MYPSIKEEEGRPAVVNVVVVVVVVHVLSVCSVVWCVIFYSSVVVVPAEHWL